MQIHNKVSIKHNIDSGSQNNVASKRQRSRTLWRKVRMALTVSSVVKDYCQNSSFHGLRYVADGQYHWTERLFWLACCLLSWYGSWMLIRSSWDAFQNNAISFATDTNFIDWNTEFPAIAVCETDNDARIDFMRSKIEPEDDRNYDMDDVYREITYFRGEAYIIRNLCFNTDDSYNEDFKCPTKNLSEIADIYLTPCELTFGECKWNGKPFNCCDHFLPLVSEIGTCYTFNSIQTTPISDIKIKTQSNRKTGASSLLAQVKVPSTVYVMARQDVPSMNTIERVKFSTKAGSFIRRWYSVKDIENDGQVKGTQAKQRGCRFVGEGGLDVFPKYSYSACLTQCRTREQQRLCGCVSHQTPNAQQQDICDIEGLKCLHDHYLRLSILKPKGSTLDRLQCLCSLSCEDQELKDTYGTMEKVHLEDPRISVVEILIDRLPTVRFIRKVIRGKLDLVVSMGGTTGLLVGASLLSFVEVVYFFTLRTCGGNTGTNKKQKTGNKTQAMSVCTVGSSKQFISQAIYNNTLIP